MQNKNYWFHLAIALFWLFLIYAFLPFGPKVINFFIKKFSFSVVKNYLLLFSVIGGIFGLGPFFIKFKLKRLAPYLIAIIALVIGCAINVSLKIPARTLHIPEYAVLGILLHRAFTLKYSRYKSYGLSFLMGSIAGIADERVIQFLLPMRYYDIADIMLNLTGVFIGLVLAFAYNLKNN